MDRHRLAEARSLAAHELIAARLVAEQELLDRARALVAAWLDTGEGPSRCYAEQWAAILRRDAKDVAAAIVDPSEHGTALRQCTPFAGAIDPRTRWRLWDDVRRALEGA